MVTTDEVHNAYETIGLPVVESIERIHGGSNESFRIDTADETFVAKFNTFSRHRTFCAEVHTLRYLRDAGILPVPNIVAVEDDRFTRPAPFFVTRYIEGYAPTPLTELYDRHLVRQMGFVAMCLTLCDPDDLHSYGRITHSGDEGGLEATDDSWRDYYQTYVHGVLNDADWTAPDFLQEYIGPLHDAIDTRIDAIPESPDPAIILPDLRLDNLLVNDDGHVSVVLDFERADIGDSHFTLANTHYLLGRGLDDSGRARLRDDLAEGFDGWMSDETEQTYRLGALAKEVRAFDHWWKNVPDEEYESHKERLLIDLDAAL